MSDQAEILKPLRITSEKLSVLYWEYERQLRAVNNEMETVINELPDNFTLDLQTVCDNWDILKSYFRVKYQPLGSFLWAYIYDIKSLKTGSYQITVKHGLGTTDVTVSSLNLDIMCEVIKGSRL